jgi:hypothetical protein
VQPLNLDFFFLLKTGASLVIDPNWANEVSKCKQSFFYMIFFCAYDCQFWNDEHVLEAALLFGRSVL